MNVLFVGDSPSLKTSPLNTWAKSLERVGVKCHFVDPKKESIREWLVLVTSFDFAIYQGYSKIDLFEYRQLSIAVMMGCPVIRKWSGSDIYFALNDLEVKAAYKKLDSIISLNLTSEHNGIVDELNSIGMNCALTPQVIDMVKVNKTLSDDVNKNILVYLPDSKYDFYGYQTIKKLVEAFPNLKFTIIADKKHRLSSYENVTSLGWVSNMEAVWDVIGLVIRITEHDGFPRMIVEALARGKYVIHNRKFDGVWCAQDIETIKKSVSHFSYMTRPNQEGVMAVKALVSGESDLLLLKSIKQAKTTCYQRILALFTILKCELKLKVIKLSSFFNSKYK